MAANPNWWNPAWLYRLDITVDHTKVTTDMTELLINITEAHLSNALANGDDILLCKDNNDDQLNHEIEYFHQASGKLVLWVKHDISSSADTLFYLYYGNAASGNQQNVNGTWKSAYKLIQHLQETTGNRIDSTSNTNDGVPTNVTAIEGKIDGADQFSGTGNLNFGHGASLDIVSAITLSAWVKAPFIPITNIDELQAINNNLSANYVLLNDIDASATSGWNGGVGFDPIGDYGTHFTGIFNGNGFKITNLFINRPTECYIGLFGVVDDVIENVGLENANIAGSVNCGGIVGLLDHGRMKKCWISGTVTSDNNYNGGLIGYSSYSNVDNCFSTCNVVNTKAAAYYVGGLIGYRNRCHIYTSYFAGTVSWNPGSYAAAVVGRYRRGATDDNGFYDNQVTDKTDDRFIGKTTAEMKQEATYASWDFTDIWEINEGVSYPTLRAGSPSEYKIISKGQDAYSLEINHVGTEVRGYVNNTELTHVLTSNVFSHIALKYDGTNLDLFVNGVKVETTLLSGAINTNVTDLTSGNSSKVIIDEIQVIDEAKSDDLIETEYNNQNMLANFWGYSQIDALYFDLKIIDSSAVAIETSRIVVRDNVDVIVTEEDTLATGSISQQAYINSKTAHAILAYKYGKKVMPSVLDIAKDLDWTFTLYDDSYITEVTEATVAAYTGITIDHAAENITISENHTIEEIYDYCQHNIIANTQSDINQTMSTGNGINFSGEYDFIINTGITVSADDKKLTMVAGKTYTLTGTGHFTGIIADQTKTRVPIKLSGLIAGSRLQIYDTDSSSELYNEIEATTEFLEYFEHTIDVNVRVRIMHVDGIIAYEWWTTNGTITNTGFSLNISQEFNKPYNDNNVDGSTVTECAINGDKIDINVDDPDNTLAVQRIYSWYQYYLFTEAGIRDSDDKITATDATHYTFDNDVQIINLDTANPLNLTGANIVPVSGLATSIFDLSNGASIALNFERVEAFSCKESLEGVNDIKGTGFVKDTDSLVDIRPETDKIQTVDDNVDRILKATEIKQCIITDASATSLSFTTNLTETSNQFWQRGAILITSGNNEGQMRAILNYNGSTKAITLKTPLDVAPAQNDTFIILTERKYLTPDIEDIIDTVWDEPASDHVTSGTMGEYMKKIKSWCGWLRSLL